MPANPLLVRIPTTDGLLLDGALFEPASPTFERNQARAWVFLHGSGSNFTATGILDGLAVLLSSRGEAVLRLNTRGHDFVAKIPGMSGSVLGGAAFENLGDAPLDAGAAAAWLVDAGFSQISLLGHSLGAVKAILTQAKQPASNVDEIVALSPPRLRHEQLIRDDVFRNQYERARQLVDAGQGSAFLEMTSPVPLWMPAEQVVDKYGPDDRYDFVTQLPNVETPTLIFLDTKSLETSAAFQGLEETLGELAKSHSALSVQRHPDDIRYAGSEVAIANHIVAWRHRLDAVMDAGI